MSAAMVELDWKFFKYVLRPLIFRNILAEQERPFEGLSCVAPVSPDFVFGFTS
jgi:hypothetical protein